MAFPLKSKFLKLATYFFKMPKSFIHSSNINEVYQELFGLTFNDDLSESFRNSGYDVNDYAISLFLNAFYRYVTKMQDKEFSASIMELANEGHRHNKLSVIIEELKKIRDFFDYKVSLLEQKERKKFWNMQLLNIRDKVQRDKSVLSIEYDRFFASKKSTFILIYGMMSISISFLINEKFFRRNDVRLVGLILLPLVVLFSFRCRNKYPYSNFDTKKMYDYLEELNLVGWISFLKQENLTFKCMSLNTTDSDISLNDEQKAEGVSLVNSKSASIVSGETEVESVTEAEKGAGAGPGPGISRDLEMVLKKELIKRKKVREEQKDSDFSDPNYIAKRVHHKLNILTLFSLNPDKLKVQMAEQKILGNEQQNNVINNLRKKLKRIDLKEFKKTKPEVDVDINSEGNLAFFTLNLRSSTITERRMAKKKGYEVPQVYSPKLQPRKYYV